MHCDARDLRVRWKLASDLRFRAAISEPKTPSCCGISGDFDFGALSFKTLSSAKRKRDRGRDSRPPPRPRLNSQPQGTTRVTANRVAAIDPLLTLQTQYGNSRRERPVTVQFGLRQVHCSIQGSVNRGFQAVVRDSDEAEVKLR